MIRKSRKLYSSLCTLRRGPSAATLAASASLAAWALWAMKFDWILPSLPSLANTPHITQNPRKWLKSSHEISNPRMQHQLLRLAVLHISCTLVKHTVGSALGWISWIKKCVRIATAQLCKCVLPTSPACQAKLPIHGMQHLMLDCKQEGKVFWEGTATVRNRETWLAALDAVKHGFQIYAPIHQQQLKGTEDGSNCCTNWA